MNFVFFALIGQFFFCWKRRPNRFHSLYCLFLFFFSSRLCSQFLLGDDINCYQWNFHLHCSHPVTTIICHSGSILIKRQGYLSITRLPMKISVASGNEENMFLWMQAVLDLSHSTLSYQRFIFYSLQSLHNSTDLRYQTWQRHRLPTLVPAQMECTLNPGGQFLGSTDKVRH